jgi:hypothetical protein
LRVIGFSLDKIKLTKQFLYRKLSHPGFKITPEKDLLPQELVFEATALEFAVLFAMNSRARNIFLLIDESGDTAIQTDWDLTINRVLHTLPSIYVCLNLNKLFKEWVGKVFEEKQEVPIMNENEAIALNYIRHNKDDKLTIKQKNGEITHIEKEYGRNPEDIGSIHEIIDDVDYGYVILRRNGGKTCHVEAVKTDKVKK